MPFNILKSGAIALAAAAAVAMSGCGVAPPAQRAAASGGQCFNAARISGYETFGDGLVLVRAGGNRTYALQVAGPCPDLRWSRGVAVRTLGGGSWVCSGLDAQLVVPSPVGAQYCPVAGIRGVSPQEARALRASRR